MAENEEYSKQEVMQLLTGFQKSRILLTAIELDLFNELGEKSLTASELAVETRTDPDALATLLNALAAIRFLDKQGERYSNAGVSEKYFLKTGESYLGGAMHQVHLWETWNRLTENVRKGQGNVTRPEVNDRSSDWLDAFISAMDARGAAEAQMVKPLIGFDGIKRILDLGGGSGVFATTFIRNDPTMSAVVFDLPNVLPLTREYVDKHNMNDRIITWEGNYLTDDLGTGYDMVFLSAVIHSNSYDENALIIRKCAESLNPGGKVVVMDFIVDDDRTRPLKGALFAINMLVATEGGTTYTAKEVEAWMQSAGLGNFETKEADRGIRLITGYLAK